MKWPSHTILVMATHPIFPRTIVADRVPHITPGKRLSINPPDPTHIDTSRKIVAIQNTARALGWTSTPDWPLSWRIMILLNISFYNMMGNIFTSGIPPLFSLLIEDFHCSANEAAHLTTYALLMLGLANCWAVPVVEYLGKRYTILISMAVFLAANIWAATAQSYSSLRATRFLGGISGGAIEALGPLIVSECFSEGQLASAMVVYVGFLAAGSSIGPIVAGGIASGLHSWRWFFIVTSIATGINLVSCILMLPSTSHTVDNCTSDDATQQIKSTGTVNQAEFVTPSTDNETRLSENLWKLWIRQSFSLRTDRVGHKENPLRLFIRPFPMLLVPEVLVTTLVFGLTIGWVVVTSVLVSTLFAMPPNLWPSWKIGFLNFGPLVGLVIGLPVGGAVADLLSRRATKNSDGEHDPRSRLPLVLLGALLSPTGCVIIGWSLNKDLLWAGTTVGWGLLAFGLTSSANILLTYCVDSHRSRAMDVGVLVNVIKNTIGFGVSYAAIDWRSKSGAEAQYGTMAGILWAFYLLVIPLYFFRDSLRKITARNFAHMTDAVVITP
ncbi:MFS transporter, putative [Talaromyces stipitatus ATCC 10500]|uniref:MFS transporter, putative n=1 Tax=Talaromyces stipitatus (strain ATCC 10500 / CBS 375.48 / QM 6759 / NRRL 1006) TaxID=441959 RepID=B8MGF2_TALSN|nr:MFS transporter, putative [Talaromyces stipitatus ATCC 10500]EED16272.1 MFS transporter, putative [Talaromyces stipitatus ATCC 10500]